MVGVGLPTLPIKKTCYKSFNDKKPEYSPGQGRVSISEKQQGTNWSGMTRAAQNRVRWRGGGRREGGGGGVVDGLCSTGSDGHK